MAKLQRAFAVALALSTALGLGTAHAQPALTAQSIPDITLGNDAIADADAEMTQSAADDAAAHGILAVRDHESQLRQVLANMPNPFVRTRTEGGRLVYRADSRPDCELYASGHGTDAAGMVCQGNPYASAGFYLGSYYNEIGQSDQALTVLDLGLVAGPDSPILIAERDAALASLHRWDDELAGSARGLAIANLSATDHALMLRNRGYALTELQRLDEAKQAYEQSLKLDPDNALAKNELAYIASLKAGATPTQGGMLMPNRPKSN